MALYKSRSEYDRKKAEREKCRKDPKRRPEQCKTCTFQYECDVEGTQRFIKEAAQS